MGVWWTVSGASLPDLHDLHALPVQVVQVGGQGGMSIDAASLRAIHDALSRAETSVTSSYSCWLPQSS